MVAPNDPPNAFGNHEDTLRQVESYGEERDLFHVAVQCLQKNHVGAVPDHHVEEHQGQALARVREHAFAQLRRDDAARYAAQPAFDGPEFQRGFHHRAESHGYGHTYQIPTDPQAEHSHERGEQAADQGGGCIALQDLVGVVGL